MNFQPEVPYTNLFVPVTDQELVDIGKKHASIFKKIEIYFEYIKNPEEKNKAYKEEGRIFVEKENEKEISQIAKKLGISKNELIAELDLEKTDSQIKRLNFRGSPQFTILKKIRNEANILIQDYGYPPEAVEIGVRHFLQQRRGNNELLKPLSKDMLNTCCFQGLVEMAAGKETEQLPELLHLFSRIQDRHIPLTRQSQRIVQDLVTATLHSSFTHKGLKNLAVQTKFGEILKELECSSVKSLNGHESPDSIIEAFEECLSSMFQLVDIEDIIAAIEKDPIACAKKILTSISDAILQNAKEEEKISFQNNIEKIFASLESNGASKELGDQINAQIVNTGLRDLLKMSLEFDVDISTEVLATSILEDLEVMEKDPNATKEPKRYGSFEKGLIKLTSSISTAQEERKKSPSQVTSKTTNILSIIDTLIWTTTPARALLKTSAAQSVGSAGMSLLSVFSPIASYLSPIMPNIDPLISKIPELFTKSKKTSSTKSSKSVELLSNFRKIISLAEPTKELFNFLTFTGMFTPSASKILSLLLDDQIKKKSEKNQELPPAKSSNEQIKLLEAVKTVSSEVTEAATSLFTTLIENKSLNEHKGLIDYLQSLSDDPEKKVDETELLSHLASSSKILINDFQNHAGIVENLLATFRSLPEKSTVPKPEAKRAVPQVPILTSEQQENQKTWKAHFEKAIETKYSDPVSRDIAKHLEVELNSSFFIDVYQPAQLKNIVSLIGIGASIHKTHKNVYTSQEIAIGCRRFLQRQLIEKQASPGWTIEQLISDSDRKILLPFCFEAIVENQARLATTTRKEKNLPLRTVSLFRKMEGRDIPLTVEGKQRLQSLALQTISPEFAGGKSLVLPSVTSRFKAILKSVDCLQVSSLNRHPSHPENLGNAFLQSSRARCGKVNMGKVRDAISENPSECTKKMIVPIVTILMKDSKEAPETLSTAFEIIDNLSKAEAGKAASRLIKNELNQFKILRAANVDVNIDSDQAIKILREQVTALRNPTEKTPQNALGRLIFPAIRAIATSQEERNQNTKELSPLAEILPKISKKISKFQKYTSFFSFLGGIIPIPKVFIRWKLEKIIDKKIEKLHASEKELKALRKGLPTEKQQALDKELERIHQLIELLKSTKKNADKIIDVAVNVFESLLKKHDLSKHDGLFNYLVTLEDPSVKVDEDKLLKHLLDSADVVFDEIDEHYKELIPELLDAFRGL